MKTKDLKVDKLLKWCNSAGKQFHGLTTLFVYSAIFKIAVYNVVTFWT